MSEGEVIRVAFYIRVSTPEQGKRGYGLDYQLEALHKLVEYKKDQSPSWITNKKWLYEDSGCSGGDLNRPGYKQMIEGAKNGDFDMIAVWKIDRMSRNLSHLLTVFEELKSYNVGFFSIKENIDFTGPIGKLTFQIFGALAEFEREMIKTRTVEGKLASARQGNYVRPSAPYGYNKVANLSGKGSKLIIFPEEAGNVKNIFNWFMYEDLNYTQIAKRLTDLSVEKGEGRIRKDIKGTKWYDTTVTRILEDTHYIGYIDYCADKNESDTDVRIIVPKIIPQHLFDLAQIKMKEVSDKNLGGTRKYLLSGKIIDLETGRKFVGVARTKGGHSYRRKGFTDACGSSFPNKEFSAKSLDDFVWGHIVKFVDKPRRFFKLFKKETTELKNIDRYRNEIDDLNMKLIDIEGCQESIQIKELRGRLSEERADKLLIESKGTEKSILSRKNELEDKIEYLLNIELGESVITESLLNYKDKIDDLTLQQRMRLIDLLVDSVNISESKDGDMEVDIVFRFAHDVDNDGDSMDELSKGSNKIKNTLSGAVLFGYGTLCRVRTHDLLVRSQALFQLS